MFVLELEQRVILDESRLAVLVHSLRTMLYDFYKTQYFKRSR